MSTGSGKLLLQKKMEWTFLVVACFIGICWTDGGLQRVEGDKNLLDVCRFSVDLLSNVSKLDCRNLGLRSINITQMPVGVEILDLDLNEIEAIPNRSFHLCTHLKALTIRNNGLRYLDQLSFDGLNSLEILDLRNNKLVTTGHPWSSGIFRTLENLRILNLADNGNIDIPGSFPSNLFQGLDKLDTLYLDTFYSILDFNSAFSNVTNLRSLFLTGGMTKMTNVSFQQFLSIPLVTLQVESTHNLVYTELCAFQYMKYLKNYKFITSIQGLSETFEGLYAFQNRNLTYLTLDNIGKSTFSTGGKLLLDGILDSHKTRYLSQICVEHFTLRKSKVYVIESDTLTGPVWRSCLKSADFSGNPLIGDRAFLWTFLRMPSLQHMHSGECKSLREPRRADLTPVWATMNSGESSKLNVGDVFLSGQRNVLVGAHSQSEKWSSDDRSFQNATSSVQDLNSTSLPGKSGFVDSKFKVLAGENEILQTGYFILPVSQNLKVLKMDSLSDNMGPLKTNILLHGADKLREFHITDNGLRELVGSIMGLHNLKLLDISFNNCSVISPTFFDFFQSLEYLGIKNARLESEFMIEYSDRLFQPLTALRQLDLSGNSLKLFAENSFRSNQALESLNLADNKFDNIPVDFSYLPNLRNLDLRQNSILHLSEEATISLDAHSELVPDFSLKLEGNILSCDCSHLKFLQWLQESTIHFDSSGNYSCFTESGELTSTLSRKDVQALWRMCVGKTSLLASLLLAISMGLAFVVYILCTRFKTQIISVILQTFSPQFALHKPSQYPVGVYISYSDQDTVLACNFLRTFIERDLGMTSYVKDRDLIPATDIAESIVDTVNRSWRVLLVISEEYLYSDDWAYFTMKTVSYAVSPRNPGLLVILVEEKMRHKLPRCLLRAVDEKNIVCLPENGRLNYEQLQTLKTALVQT